MICNTDTDGLDYDVEAVHYPENEPEADTIQLMALLAEIAHRRRHLGPRPELDTKYPEIGRYTELVLAVERLIDCAGYPFPDYREKLIGIAALALDAAVAVDNGAAVPKFDLNATATPT
jgi:hypothetical protein